MTSRLVRVLSNSFVIRMRSAVRMIMGPVGTVLCRSAVSCSSSLCSQCLYPSGAAFSRYVDILSCAGWDEDARAGTAFDLWRSEEFKSCPTDEYTLFPLLPT